MSVQHQPGTVIAQRYRLLDTLGRGSTGITYAAKHLETGETVALKVVAFRDLDDWKSVELLEREAQVLQKLDHPAIPKYIDYFYIDSDRDRHFYIAQRLAPGQSLQTLVEQGWRTSEPELKRIAIQVLEILTYLHQLDPPVIHRDIKPENLIRSEDGTISLVDFGAVRETYQNTVTHGSTVVGTFGYMASEQFRGRAKPATDLYGLGATLLYLLTHRSPAELPHDTLKIDFRDRIQVSEALTEWLEKMLAPDLEERFTSTKQALTALKYPYIRRTKRFFRMRLSAVCLVALAFFGVHFAARYYWLNLSRIDTYPELCNRDAITVYLHREEKLDRFKAESNSIRHSIWSCDLEVADKLLAAEANVNIRDRYNNTPLIYAVRYGRSDLVKKLIAAGADLNLRNNAARTPLTYTVLKDRPHIVDQLIAAGADLNVRDNSGRTPLNWAFRDGKLHLAEKLIAAGAEIEIGDFDSYSFTRIVRSGYPHLVDRSILAGADVNLSDQSGRTLLTYAPNGLVAEKLIAAGANINTADRNGKTPLMYAAYNGHLEVVEKLLEAGAKVNVQDNDGMTPLAHANLLGYQNVAEILKQYGATE
jgi:serine/threonine protein kinase